MAHFNVGIVKAVDTRDVTWKCGESSTELVVGNITPRSIKSGDFEAARKHFFRTFMADYILVSAKPVI